MASIKHSVKYYLSELEREDPTTYAHCVRCGNALALFARKMGITNENEIQSYREAGYMHDVGKLSCMKNVKSNINIRAMKERARQEAALEPDKKKAQKIIDLADMKADNFVHGLRVHVTFGRATLKSIRGADENMKNAIEEHHLTWKRNDRSYCADSIVPSIRRFNDTSKCPEGNKISTIAQMLHIIDDYDAMKFKRQYQEEQMSQEQIDDAMEFNLKNGSYNPALYGAFKKYIKPWIDNTPLETLTKAKVLKAEDKELLINAEKTLGKLSAELTDIQKFGIKAQEALYDFRCSMGGNPHSVISQAQLSKPKINSGSRRTFS